MGKELQLALLGNVELCRDGVPVTGFRSGKAQALLCYLAVTARPHLRPALAGLLWGELPEASAQNNLRKALTNLRQVVGPYLNITRQAVAFNRDSRYWLDVQVLQAQVGGAATEAASTRADIEQLQGAVELYRGDFLEGFYVRRALAFEEWVLAQRLRLRGLALRALHTLVVYYAGQGQAGHAAGIDYTTRLLALEPWREEAHQQLMLLLARSGQRGAALAQYEACRKVLAEDLGVEPGPTTRELHQRICEGEVRCSEPGRLLDVTLDVEAPRLPPHNLPPQPTPFVGREAELADLDRLIANPDVRLITIVGPGGMGKTRLALAAAERQLDQPADHSPTAQKSRAALGAADCAGHSPAADCAGSRANPFVHGVFFVPLAPLSSVDHIMPTLARALDFQLHGGDGRTPERQVHDYLRHKHVLLILDNLEHLLDSVDIITDILHSALGVQILVTSRERLHLQQEQVFAIQGLEFLEWETFEEAAKYPAAWLFLQSAQRVQREFHLKTADLPYLYRICRLAEGMPLALELAAAWVDSLSLADITTEMQHSLDILETEWRDVPARHRSMRAVFDTSWGRLSQAERDAFAQLAVFRGGFTRQAAQAVITTGEGAPASPRLLARLVNKSLLTYEPARDRWTVHELLRQYGADQLASNPGDEAAVRDRHSAYYCALLQQREVDFGGARVQKAVAQLEVESENARAAWRWAGEGTQTERLQLAVDGLGRFYMWVGRYREGEAACQIAAEKLATVAPSSNAPGERQRLSSSLLTWRAQFNRDLGRTEMAGQLLQESLDLLDSSTLTGQDTRMEKANALMALGSIAERSDYREAGRLYEKALGLYQEVEDNRGTVKALLSMGSAALNLGRCAEAKLSTEESLTVYRALGDQRGIETAIRTLGWIALCQGELETAECLQRESLAIALELNHQPDIAGTLRTLGAVLVSCGRFTEARSVLEESVALYDDLGAGAAMVFPGVLLGTAAVHLGWYESAHSQGQASLALAQEVDDQAGVAHALLLLGRVALVREAYVEAQSLLSESVTIFQTSGKQDDMAQALALSGYATRALKDRTEAQRELIDSLHTASEIEAFHPLLPGLPAIALLLADEGETERAVEVYALAFQQPHVANSRWFEDVVGKQIATVAETLPPEVVAAARERGRSRDLWEATETLRELGWAYCE